MYGEVHLAQSFKIKPAGAAANNTLIGLAAFCALIGAGMIWWFSGFAPAIGWVVGLLMVGLGGFFLWVRGAQANSSVEITGSEAILWTPLYGRTIALSSVTPGSVAIGSLTKDEANRLKWRTNGLGVPGYQLGWFRTYGGVKALVAATGDAVVTFRTSEGYSVFVSAADNAGLGAALRAAVKAK